MNATFVQQLKMVDEKYKLFVNGYVRKEYMNKYKLSNIPSSIIDLCIIFSCLLFEWDLETKSKYMESDNDSYLVHKSHHECANIYSKTILDTKAIYILTIKVNKHSCGIFGIVNASQHANDKEVERDTFALCGKDGFGYGGAFGYKYKTQDRKYASYADKPGPNKIVEMTFDKIKGELSYKVDGKDCGIAWDSIDTDKMYKWAGYISSSDESFKITDFKVQWS